MSEKIENDPTAAGAPCAHDSQIAEQPAADAASLRLRGADDGPETWRAWLLREWRRSPYTAVSLLAHGLPLVLLVVFQTTRIVRPAPEPVELETPYRVIVPPEVIDAAVPEPQQPADLKAAPIPRPEEPADTESDAPPLSEPPRAPAAFGATGPGADAGAEPGFARLGALGFDGGAVADGPSGGGNQGSALDGWRKRGGGAFGLGGGLRDYAAGLRETGLDIVFIIDSTGSMGDCIDGAKQRVNEMLTVLGMLVPQFRLGIVTYRDKGDEYVVKSTPLTPLHWQAVDFLDHIVAEGGGDPPEAVQEGLRTAFEKMAWSKSGKRIAILVGDAPPHPEDVTETRALVWQFGHARGTLHAVFSGEADTSTDDRRTRALFERLATSTGGLLIDWASQHQLIGQVLPVIFGREYEVKMRKQIADAETGHRAQFFAKLVAEGSGATIRAELAKDRASQGYLLGALARDPRREHLGALLDAVAASDVTLDSKWAALVLAKRLLRAAGAQRRVRDLADDVVPTLARPVLAERLRELHDNAVRFGMARELIELPKPKVAPK